MESKNNAHKFSIINRTYSLNKLTFTLNKTLAEINKVSVKLSEYKFHVNKPVRIVLPEYFNIPKFEDQHLSYNQRVCAGEGQ